MISDWVLLLVLGWEVEYLDALRAKLRIIVDGAIDLNDDITVDSGNR